MTNMLIDEKESAAVTTTSASRPALTFDIALYEELFAQSGIAESEKTELLKTLWEIIVGFVDLGFNIHPLQQNDERAPKVAASLTDMIQSAGLFDGNNSKKPGRSKPSAQAKREL